MNLSPKILDFLPLSRYASPHVPNSISFPLMNQLERIATLLAQGLPAASVATIVGLSPARISQIQKEEGFALLLQGKQAEIEEKDAEEIAIGAKYLEAEHMLIKQVIELAPVAELRDVTAALRVVAERQERAKSRISPVHQGSLVLNNVIQLSLPQHATPELHLSAQKEVIAIENRNLAPLSSAGVLSLFKGLGQDKQLPNNATEGERNEPLTDSASTKESVGEALSPPTKQEKPLVEASRDIPRPREAERSEAERGVAELTGSISPISSLAAQDSSLASSALAQSAKRFLEGLSAPRSAPFAGSF